MTCSSEEEGVVVVVSARAWGATVTVRGGEAGEAGGRAGPICLSVLQICGPRRGRGGRQEVPQTGWVRRQGCGHACQSRPPPCCSPA